MLNYKAVPVSYMMSGLKMYVEHGIEPGAFLAAVLKNDLREAVVHGDSTNLQQLPEWVRFCYSELPADIWGSPAKVQAHLDACAKAREK